MLTMIDLEDTKEYTIDIDYYVPFNIDMIQQNRFKENKIYWIAGNNKDALIEIGIGESTGELMSITLTAASKVTTDKVVVNTMKVIEGSPKFDISKLNSKFNNELLDFQVVLTKNFILVSFDSTFDIETITKMDRLEIGFGIDNDISLIKINNLTKKEYNDLKDSFIL